MMDLVVGAGGWYARETNSVWGVRAEATTDGRRRREDQDTLAPSESLGVDEL
ncbi:MAG TPA: hypothetical protein VM943_05525 [Pyrinomonadaceae bacterium]|nr:hypothetical protein [Pyrinomonadaceae bacterium]